MKRFRLTSESPVRFFWWGFQFYSQLQQSVTRNILLIGQLPL
jgi:hypothetical protein